MHRSLLVQEIVRAIMNWVDSPGTALAVVLSSRALAAIALEAVWRHGNAWNLAMTMPKLYRHIITTKNGSRHVVSTLMLEGNFNTEE